MRKLKLKSIFLVLLFVTITITFISCDKDFADGFDAGYNGYTYIGSADSESECSNNCYERGYTYYRYNYELENCYCK